MDTSTSQDSFMGLEANLRRNEISIDDIMIDEEVAEEILEDEEESTTSQGHVKDSSPALLEGLPNKELILSYLKLLDISQVSLVSKRLQRACRGNALWKLKFEERWKIDERFRVVVTGQSWYKAYQEAYRNPHDLWIFHWNNCFPQDGLVPGRCCIYDGSPSTEQVVKQPHDLCPPCRFFPNHPLQYFINSKQEKAPLEESPSRCQNIDHLQPSPELTAEATDRSIYDFCKHHGISTKSEIQGTTPYSIHKARKAFAQAATFHRTINTQQYTAASPSQESESSTCLAQCQDLLFFNVADEPLSTTEGAKELQHLKEERDSLQEWEQNLFYSREQRRSPPKEFLKPAFETSHHSWHQVVFTNPDFMKPLVFRISVARPDCFTVFPSEGILNAGESKVITFGVRPLGSLVATAFETINAQRHDAEDWMKQVYNEEGTLPCQPFAVRYKYGSLIPCVPAFGFVPPHRAQPRQEVADANGNSSDTDQVENILWENKQTIDYHWAGGDTADIVNEAEIRCILLSAHVNAQYPFSIFRNRTMAPFELCIEPAVRVHQSIVPMLYFAAPQLYEFYPESVYPQLQKVHLETEVSHAGQVFRSHRQKCISCRRTSWGTRLEEMGQAFVLARLQDWLCERRQEIAIKNGLTIIKTLVETQKKKEKKDTILDEDFDCVSSWSLSCKQNERELIQSQRLLHVCQKMIMRHLSSPYVSQELIGILIPFEIIADSLYGINAQQIVSNMDSNAIPWKKAGVYRYATSTQSVFERQNDLGMIHRGSSDYLKDEPEEMEPFRYLLHTPGSYNLGPQEDWNHPSELQAPAKRADDPWNQPASATDIFMNDPVQSFRCAVIMIQDPRSVLVHGIYDRVPYPGKVVRRPKMPLWLRNINKRTQEEDEGIAKNSFHFLQDALDLYHLLPQSYLSVTQSFSLRRYLRNVPQMGVARLGPVCIDDGCTPNDMPQNKKVHVGGLSGVGTTRSDETGDDCSEKNDEQEIPDSEVNFSPNYRIVELTFPARRQPQCNSSDEEFESSSSAPPLIVNRPGTARLENQRRGENRAGAELANNRFVGARNARNRPPLLPGPGPRLLNLLWTISAQLGWNVEEGSHGTTSVYLRRELLIALQWLSLTAMASPLFLTLVARATGLVPVKPVDYLVDMPHQRTNEMRFLSESECGVALVALLIIWLFLGRYAERSTGRDLQRQMLDHGQRRKNRQATTFWERVKFRYEKKWDDAIPIALQRLTYTCSWNRQSIANLMNSVRSARCDDGREYRSIFDASSGRGLMLAGRHNNDSILFEDHSSRKLLFSTISALGSFTCSTPHFWMNLLTVFSSSISLGLSMSVSSLEKGVIGGTHIRSVLKSKLVTLVTLITLVGQLLGSSGGVLFLAEFVVTSISFLLGGAGTISASSVESWGCFFCLSTAAFWGYLLSRVALMDGIILQKRHVRNTLFSTTLLCTSLVAVTLLWIWISLFWRWDVPASLMILRSGRGFTRTAGPDKVSAAASRTVARSAAAEYAAKNLQ